MMQQLDAKRHWRHAYRQPAFQGVQQEKFHSILPEEVYLGWSECLNPPGGHRIGGRDLPENPLAVGLYGSGLAAALQREQEK